MSRSRPLLPRPARSARTRTLSAAGLAGPLIGMAVLHGLVPKQFDALVPGWIPGTARFWTYASGVAELAVGAAVAVPATRRVGAGAAVGLFLGVFPANLQMAWDAWHDWRSGEVGGWYAWGTLARLPLQLPMIWWAWRVRLRTR